MPEPEEQLPENIDQPRADRSADATQQEVKRRKATKPAPSPEDWVPFVSSEDETVAFDFAGFPAIRWGKRLAWRVPAIYRENMHRHIFVQTGRVREATKEEVTLVMPEGEANSDA
jgi:hypothetical protein